MRKNNQETTLNLFLFIYLISVFSLFSLDVPVLENRVNDKIGILSKDTVRMLEEKLKEHEKTTTNQIAILIIPSLEGEVLEEYSLKVAETWKLGQKGKDNGILLLVAKNDRKLRIEVGYGLEGQLTDVQCGRIIREQITPEFKRGNFDDGIIQGTDAILGTLDGSFVMPEEKPINNEIPISVRLMVTGIFLLTVGTFTTMAVMSSGAMSWFLFFFLIPFWATFPHAIFGFPYGFIALVFYIIGFIIFKIYFATSDSGKKFIKDHDIDWNSGGSGRSSGGGWSSSGGGGFSGGGGSFGGGGSSGSW